MSVDINKKASDFLSGSKTTFYSFKRNWDSFATEVPQKFMSLIRSGLSYGITKGDQSSYGSGPRTISVGLEFKMNSDPAKEYLETVKEKLKKYETDLTSIVKDIDRQLNLFVDEGVDSDIFKDFISHINDCARYFSEMELKIGGHEIGFETPDEVSAIQNKWKKASDVEIRKNEAKKYGVTLEMLDTHKKYLAAVDKKKTGKTSTAIKEVKKTLLSLNGYLDSATLASDCDEIIKKFLAKEAEEKRIAEEKRAEEERIRKEKERQRKLAEEEKKKKEKAAKEHMDATVAECNGKVDEFSKELDSALKNHLSVAQNQINSKLEELNKQKADKEAFLSTLGFFKFADKKETRNAIMQIDNEISRLKNPELLKEEKKAAKKVYDKALNDYSKKVKKYLESRFPGLVPKPVEYDIPNDNEGLKLQILLALTKGGRKTVDQIQEAVGIESNQKTSALVRQLKEADELIRSEEKGKAVFTLAGSAQSVLNRLPVKPTIPSYTEVEKYAKEGCPVPPQVKDIKLPASKI